MCAAASGDVDCVRAILEAGSDPSASGSGGTTALIAAQRCADPEPIIRLLIDAGADVDAGNTWGGDRPLIAATIKGQLRIVALLLEAGANPAAKDEDGQTARERALECGQEDIAALLANWEMARRESASSRQSLGGSRGSQRNHVFGASEALNDGKRGTPR